MLQGVHDDRLDISQQQAAALIADQLPALAGRDVVRVEGPGTVNAVFRIGASVAARFPLRYEEPHLAARHLRRQLTASAEFVLASSVPAPEPLDIGRPGHGYPMRWSTQTWLPGVTADPTSHETSDALALDLAGLVQQLRAWDVRGRRFAGPGRGGRLQDHDRWVDECIGRSHAIVDTVVMQRLWTRFRTLPREDPDVMSHTDLIPTNVLVAGDRLCGVLDTGGFQAADPALDLVAAWHFFEHAPRERVRIALGCSDLQWERGAAWAFEQAIGAYWYYRDANPVMADMGRVTLERLVGAFG